MSRTLLRPRALLSHVVVLVVVATCVAAGQWQLHRLEERRETNARLEQRLAAEPVELSDLTDGALDDAALEYRRVTASGTYLPQEELLLSGTQAAGQAGFDVFTPLELDGGTLVLVRRGWVPRAMNEPPVADAAPPTGEVRIEGYLERSVPEPDGLGPRNPAEGELDVIQIPDLARIAPQLDGELFGMTVRLVDQDPPPIASEAVATRGLEALPVIAEVAPFDERNHLSYAIQWHSFALIALVAYVAWWVKRLREGEDPPVEGIAPDAARADHERRTSDV